MNNHLLVIIFIVVVFVLGSLLYVYNPEPVEFKSPDEKNTCTAEAKLCPDGSYVSRSGPNCEFELCPPFADKTIPPEAIFEDGTIMQ